MYVPTLGIKVFNNYSNIIEFLMKAESTKMLFMTAFR
jgi:hypothetical protein